MENFKNTHAWCYTYSFDNEKTKKRPTIKIGLSEENYHTFEELKSQSATGNIGFHLTKYHPYIIIDIDHSLSIPEPLDNFPTYTETTLSHQGLRLVYKLDDKAYKYYKIDHSITYIKARKGAYWDGQISVTNNFMVMTGNAINDTPIYTLSQKDFAFILSVMTATKKVPTTVSPELDLPTVPTSLTPRKKSRELEKLVMSLPIDQSYLIKQAYEKVTNAEYCHYDFWLLVGMAIYNECEDMPKGIALFNKWSAQDRENYTGESDTAKKFLSFSSERDEKITIKTLKAIQSHLLFNWKTVKNKIDTNAYYNIRLGLDTLKLQVYNAMSIGYFIKGPSEIVDKYTNTQKFLNFTGPFQSDTSFSIFLASIFQEICNWPGIAWERNLFNLATSNATILYPVEEWLNTSPQIQDNNATFEELWSCFKLQVGSNEQMCKSMLYRWMMQILKMADPKHRGGANEGFLLLTGPENSRKTSFFRQLFPPLMKPFILESMENISSDKERRDLIRSLYCRPLVYFDECDTLFKDSNTGSTFKKFMTSIDQTFVDIYSKSATTGIRTAVLGGTTNIRNIRLEDTGSRRLWIIPIEYIDMERMSKIPRLNLFKNMQKEYNIAVSKGETPWVMSQEEAIEISHSNLEFGTTTNLEEVLKEIFVWPNNTHHYKMTEDELKIITKSPQKVNHPHLYKQKMLIHLIELNAPTGFKINMTSLKNELIALSKRFTGHKTPIDIGKYRYVEGKLYVPMSNGSNRTYWLLPELQSDIINPFTEMEDDNGQA